MSKRIAVVIGGDPAESHRPVEALRIALGLLSGDHEATVVLLGRSVSLLSEETDDIVDAEILEKYRPSLQQLKVPFWIEETVDQETLMPGFVLSRRSPEDIRGLLKSVERTLIFS